MSVCTYMARTGWKSHSKAMGSNMESVLLLGKASTRFWHVALCRLIHSTDVRREGLACSQCSNSPWPMFTTKAYVYFILLRSAVLAVLCLLLNCMCHYCEQNSIKNGPIYDPHAPWATKMSYLTDSIHCYNRNKRNKLLLRMFLVFFCFEG